MYKISLLQLAILCMYVCCYNKKTVDSHMVVM